MSGLGRSFALAPILEHRLAPARIAPLGRRQRHDAIGVLREHFRPERIGVMEINRGQVDLPEPEYSPASTRRERDEPRACGSPERAFVGAEVANQGRWTLQRNQAE